MLWYSLSLHDHIEAAFNYLWSNSLSCRELHCQPGDTYTPRSADATTCSWDKLRSREGIQLLSQRSESELMNFAGPAAGFKHGSFMCPHTLPLEGGTHHNTKSAQVFSSGFWLGLKWVPALCLGREEGTEPVPISAPLPHTPWGLKIQVWPNGSKQGCESCQRSRGSAQTVLKLFIGPKMSHC